MSVSSSWSRSFHDGAVDVDEVGGRAPSHGAFGKSGGGSQMGKPRGHGFRRLHGSLRNSASPAGRASSSLGYASPFGSSTTVRPMRSCRRSRCSRTSLGSRDPARAASQPESASWTSARKRVRISSGQLGQLWKTSEQEESSYTCVGGWTVTSPARGPPGPLMGSLARGNLRMNGRISTRRLDRRCKRWSQRGRPVRIR